MSQTLNTYIRGKIGADLIMLACITLSIHKYFYGEFFSLSSISMTFISMLIWLIVGVLSGLFGDIRSSDISLEIVLFLKTFILYACIVSLLSFQLTSKFPTMRWHMIQHCGLIFLLFPVQKLMLRILLKNLKNFNTYNKKVIIVGTGNAGIHFYEKVLKPSNYGMQLTGFVDDEVQPHLNGMFLGTTDDFEKVIAGNEHDEIIVAKPSITDAQLHRIINAGEKEGKRVHILPDYQRFSTGRMQVNNMGRIPMITLRALPLDTFENRTIKRIFDFVFSLFVIVFLLSWLVPIIAVLVKFSSKGPVFFKQVRWGLRNRPIVCYKFRSMVVSSKDVDESGVYQQAIRNDPRITRIGAFLRKSNLDELPQFFNVLMGSMSVVGPRPHPVPLNIASKNQINNYMMRHWVKPGITGAAQVRGYRGETRDAMMMNKRVEHDVWYIENWNFSLDLQIIFQTVVNMVKGEKNAV